MSTKDLLPGDLISLAFKKRQNPNQPINAVAVQQQQQQSAAAGGGAGAADKSGKVDQEDANDASSGPAGGGASSITTHRNTSTHSINTSYQPTLLHPL